MTNADKWLLVTLGVVVGAELAALAYTAGENHGRQTASATCLHACEASATSRIDDLLAKLAARGITAR